MQAVTILLVSAAMSGGGQWPDENYSNGPSAPNRATTVPRGNAPTQPVARTPANNTTPPAVYNNDFDASAPSNRRPSPLNNGRRQRSVTPTEFTLPDLTSSVPPPDYRNTGSPTPQADRQAPPLVNRGSGAAEGGYDPQDFLAGPTLDDAESQSTRTYIPPSQTIPPPVGVSTNSTQFARPPATNPPIQFTREQNIAANPNGLDGTRDSRWAEQETSPQFSSPGTSPAQYQNTFTRRPQEPIYSAQNLPDSSRSNPIQSVTNTVESAAQATRQTLGDGARRVGAALETGAQSVVRESERHGSSQFLTLLILFGSIGLNLYLGWIAWDTYNRYQDLVADIRHTGPRRGSDYEGKSALAESAAY